MPAAFLYKSYRRSFYVLANLQKKEIGGKAAQKMLVKLTMELL
jgi:hypothetical protein